MDFDYLTYKIRRAGERVEDLAQALGIHPQTLRAKMRGYRTQFTQSEIQTIAERYSLTADEVNKIFIEEDRENDKK